MDATELKLRRLIESLSERLETLEEKVSELEDKFDAYIEQ